MRYSFDTSAILDGWVRYYPPASFPTMWTKLELLIFEGDAGASEEVLLELKRHEDGAADWCEAQAGFVFAVDEDIQQTVEQILEAHPNLVDAERNRSEADPFVIALAELNQCTVITGEKFSANPNKPKIPNVCAARGIPCGNLLYLIQQERWQF